MTKTSRKNGATTRMNEQLKSEVQRLYEEKQITEQKFKRFMLLNSQVGQITNATRNLGNMPGFSHNGERDNWSIAGYKKYNTVTYDDYRQLYDRDLGGRIVDKHVQSTWQKPPQISEDGDTETAFVQDVVDMASRFSMWETFSTADTQASIGEFGILLIGVNDVQRDDDGQMVGKVDFGKPIEAGSLNGLEDLLYIQPYGQNTVTQITLNGDPSSPRFQQPETYHIQTQSTESSGGTAIASTEAPLLTVHWTRIIHIAEDTLDNSVIGVPKMRRSLNVLTDILKMQVGSGEAYWRIADRGLVANIKSDVSLQTEDFDNILDAMEDYVNEYSRLLALQNAEIQELTGRDVDPSGMFQTLEKILAATSGIPNRIFFGSERGNLASGQDAKEWAATIQTRQETYAEPLVRDLIDRLVAYGAIKPPTSGSYDLGIKDETDNYVWPSILENDPKETAEIQNIYATALASAQQAQNEGANVELDEVRQFGNLQPTGESEGDMMREEDEALGSVEAGASGDFKGLNGAQITAVLEVLDRVALGVIDDVAAIELISSVGLPIEQARIIVERQKRKPAIEEVE